MLLRAHGIVVTGPDIEEMTTGVYFMEDNARRIIAASMGITRRSAKRRWQVSAELLKRAVNWSRLLWRKSKHRKSVNLYADQSARSDGLHLAGR